MTAAVAAASPAPGESSRAQRWGAAVDQLFAFLTQGHPQLVFNVSRGLAIYDKANRGYDKASHVPAGTWRRARLRLPDGQELDRHITRNVLEQHLLGKFDIAVEAPTFGRVIVFDLDPLGHRDQNSAVTADRVRADLCSRLTRLWRAFGCSAERPLVVLETPSGGLHAYLVLDRLWPMDEVLPHVVRHLANQGLELRDGQLELFPCGKPLRAPCGLHTALLDLALDGDAIVGLRRLHVDDRLVMSRRGERTQRRARHRVALTEAFLLAVERSARPLEQWVPLAPAWDAVFGPWGRREKTPSPSPPGPVLSQHLEDLGAGGWAPTPSASAKNQFSPPAHRSNAVRAGEGHGVSPAPGGLRADHLVYGRLWRQTIGALLSEGIRAEGTRHDAVLKATFHFAVERSLSSWELVREALAQWLKAFDHESRTRRRGEQRFLDECLREAKHYYETRCCHIQRRRGAATTRAGALAEADVALVEREFVPELREAARALLSMLAAQADPDGRVRAPVPIGAGLLERLLGDRRLKDDDGRRRRLSTILLETFASKGLLTLHANYRVGASARTYSCWYVFGSGSVPARAADGQLVLGTRLVREGGLEVVSSGAPRAKARVRVTTLDPVAAGRKDAWWRRMYEQRVFTPLEFFAAEEGRVLPFVGERILARKPRPLVEGASLGNHQGVVQEFSYAYGYGFAVTDDGRRVFVHQTDVDLPGFRDLAVGDTLSFELLQTSRGLRAVGAQRLAGEANAATAPARAAPEAAKLRRTLGCKPGCTCKLCWEGHLAPAVSPDLTVVALRNALGCKPGCTCKLCWEANLDHR